MDPMLQSYLAETTNVAVIVTDSRGHIEWCNNGFERISGYTLDEVVGKTPGSVVQGPDTDRDTVRRIRSELERQRPFRTELLNYSKHGKPYWISFEVHPVFDEHGTLRNFVAFEYDVTALKQAQLAAQSRARRADLLAAFAQRTFEIQNETDLLNATGDCLKEGLGASGYDITRSAAGKGTPSIPDDPTRGHLYIPITADIATHLGVNLHLDDTEANDRDSIDFIRSVTDLCSQTLARARAERDAIQLRDSLERRVASRTRELELLNESLASQITVRKDAERLAKLSQQELRSTLDELNLRVFLLDENARVLFVNTAGLDLLQSTGSIWDEEAKRGADFIQELRLLGSSLGEDMIRLADTVDGVHQQRRHGVVLQVELNSRDGATLYQARVNRTDQVDSPRILLTLEDVTEAKLKERKSAEQTAALGHVARLETMGELAAAMAHELNQPLAAVSNYISGTIRLMRSKGIEDAAITDAMQRAIVQSQRAGEIIKRIRSFSRADASNRDLHNVNDIISESVDMLRADAKIKNVLVVAELGVDMPPVLIDTIQIEQVCINLIRNALEAVHGLDRDRRIVIVSTRTDESRSEVVVAITDRGDGISQDRLETLFDPFISKKRSGLGLGLAICRSLVEAHQGKISATSTVHQGSTFEFRLPVYSSGVKRQ